MQVEFTIVCRPRSRDPHVNTVSDSMDRVSYRSFIEQYMKKNSYIAARDLYASVLEQLHALPMYAVIHLSLCLS